MIRLLKLDEPESREFVFSRHCISVSSPDNIQSSLKRVLEMLPSAVVEDGRIALGPAIRPTGRGYEKMGHLKHPNGCLSGSASGYCFMGVYVPPKFALLIDEDHPIDLTSAMGLVQSSESEYAAAAELVIGAYRSRRSYFKYSLNLYPA